MLFNSLNGICPDKFCSWQYCKAHTAFTMDLIRQESRSIYSSPTLEPGLQYLTPQALNVLQLKGQYHGYLAHFGPIYKDDFKAYFFLVGSKICW